ncbi:sigma-70 family RNA polymerase sigma factor [Echinicola vietnamensis]|uniref:RNA polymerase sigma factor, sigma-70 family n=1 Tax=Echinicola vietnamensis (strain DSM 17526 / LMG 23754 / KMM 6221) TaxID=926556 RepID=L0G667_ECHVK|nr:sigma-70 family RNA polymerase sigma factor [Echinicola vietnamensis]AGA80491.1 RNA polymerase sigma factor, sigma-70 family [Echinicola vietnamensis DSM 17526]
MKCDVYTIWETYQRQLHAYVRKRVSNTYDAEDILQTVLIKVTNHCEQRNDVAHITPWLYRITQNTINDHYKRSKKIVPTDDQTNLSREQEGGYDEDFFVWLHKFMDQLPSKYARPLHLSDIKGVPQKEIAEKLGLSLTATKSRIQRARKILRERFDECGKVEASGDQLLSYNITKSCCLNTL